MTDRVISTSIRLDGQAAMAQASAALARSFDDIGGAAQRAAAQASTAFDGLNARLLNAKSTRIAIDGSAAGALAAVQQAERSLAQIPKVTALQIQADPAAAVAAAKETARAYRQMAESAANAAANAEQAAQRRAASMAGLGMGVATQEALLAKSLRETAAETTKAADAASRRATEVQQEARVAQALNGTLGLTARAFAAVGVAQAAWNLGKTSADLQELDTRLKGVTARTGDYAGAQAFLDNLAAKHHKTISSLADGYIRLLSLEENGIVTRKEAQAITAGLSNAQSALGANTAQLGQVMYGMGQALASAVVHAEEYNQVTEPLPGLAARLDKAAGVAAGGFRKLVADGKVTNELFKTTLIKALTDFDGAAERTAGNMKAHANDMRREWELLAKTMEKPIDLIVNIGTSIGGGILKGIRTSLENEDIAWKALQTSMQRGVAPDLTAEQAGRQLVQVQQALKTASGTDAQSLRYQEQQLFERLQQLSKAAAEAGAKAAKEAAAAGANDVVTLIEAAAKKYGVAVELARAVAKVESGNQQSVTSDKGAIGIFQLMPDTARGLGVDPKNLQQNVDGGVRYLKQMLDRYKGDVSRALAAYNWGMGNLDKFGLGSAPDETKKYLEKIKAELKGADLAGKILDLEDYKRNLGDAEALFSAQMARQVAIAEDAAEKARAKLGTGRAGLDAELAGRRNARAGALLNVPLEQRPRWQGALDQQAAADAEEFARRKADLDRAELDIAEKLARAKLAAFEQERAQAAHYEKSAAERLQMDSRISAQQTELAVLAERRRALETQAATDVANAQQAEAAARDEANTRYRAQLHANIERIRQMTAALAQNIQAQQVAGMISPTEARQSLAGIYRQSAAEIGKNVQALESLGPAAAQAAVEAKTAMLEMTATVRTPMEQLAQQWSDTTAQMQNATAQWAEDFVNELTNALVYGKSNFEAFAKSILADLVRMNLREMFAGAYFGLTGGGSGGSTAAAGSAAPGAGGFSFGGFSGGASGAGGTSGLSLASGASGLGSLVFGGAAPVAYLLGSNGARVPLMGSGTFGGFTSSMLMKAGVTPVASATIGSGLQAASGYGAIAALAANMLGLKGENQIANMVLPTIGSIGGGIGGAAMGATLGAAGGPIGAIIGAILGAALSKLFHVAKPAAGAEFTFGADNTLTQTYARRHAGGSLSTLEDTGHQLAQNFRAIEQTLDVELGRFYIALQQKNTKFRVAGVDSKGNTFFDEWVKFKDDQVKDALDRFGAAVLKRKEVLRQVDDLLFRGALQVSDRLSAVEGNWKRAAAIRTYMGERTGLADDLAGMNQQYQRFRGSIVQFVGRNAEAAELAKLNAAYQRNFNTRIVGFRNRLAQFGGGSESTAAYALQQIDEQYRNLQAQDNELSSAAGRSGGALQYTPASAGELARAREQAEAALRQGVLKALRELAGAPTETTAERLAALAAQFRRVRDDAQTLGLSVEQADRAYQKAVETVRTSLLKGVMDAIKNDTQAAIDDIRGRAATIQRLSTDIGAKTAMLAAYIDPAEQEAEITKIRDLIYSRYQLEKQNIVDLIAAGRALRDTVAGLRVSDLSPLTPRQQTESAGQSFWADVAKARGGDAEAAGRLSGAAQTYLQQSRTMYASSQAYTDIYNRVTSTLEALGQAIADDGQSRLEDLQDETLTVLKGLQEIINNQNQSNITTAENTRDVYEAIAGDGGLINVVALGLGAVVKKLDETGPKSVEKVMALLGNR